MMRLTKNDMARVVVQALYNLPSLPAEADARVADIAKRKLPRLSAMHKRAVGVLMDSSEAAPVKQFGKHAVNEGGRVDDRQLAVGAGPTKGWRNDPSADERWSAGCEFALDQLCRFFGVEPKNVTWDPATETLDGDVGYIIGDIVRQRMGDDFDPMAGAA